MRERLGRGKRLEQAAAARDAVLEALLERVDVPLPETMVTDELNARRQNVEQQLAYAGLTMEKYLEDEGQTAEEFEADLERRVRDAVAAQFILDEVADKEELGVDQSELSRAHGARAPSSPARTRRSSPTTCSSTTTSPSWCRRSAAARRWPGSSSRRPSPTPPATWSS